MTAKKSIIFGSIAVFLMIAAPALKAGSAVSFDGDGDCVTVPDDDTLDGLSAVSISLWLRKAPRSDPNDDTIISKWGNQRTYALSYNSEDKQLKWTIGNQSSFDSSINPVSIEDDQWHHIVAVYAGYAGYVYLDAYLLADTATLSGGIGTNDNPLLIGKSPYPGESYNCLEGSVDEVRVYNKALSAEQVEHLCHNNNTSEPNLVAYWKFNEGQAQQVNDVTGNGNDGYLGSDPGDVDANDPDWTDSELPCCRFFIDVADGNDLNNGLSPQSPYQTIQKGISAGQDGDIVSVYPGTYTEELDFLGKAITVAGLNEPAVLRAPLYYAVSFYHGEDADSILKNFIIKDSDTAFLFANPVSPTIKNVTVVENTDGALIDFGANPDISNSIFWNNSNGDLFQFPARHSLVEDSLGMVAHWQLDEGQAGTAYDSAGGNDGIIYGDTNWTAGKVGQAALDFDGDQDYVIVPDDYSLKPAEQLTIAFWLYNRGGQSAGIYKYAACPDEPNSPDISRAYYVDVNTAGNVTLRIYSDVNDYDEAVSIGPAEFNQWHHITATFDRGIGSIYIDGQLDNSVSMSVSSIMYDNQPLIIGGYWSYCSEQTFHSRLNGSIDDIYIYGRSLAAGEIWQLYNIGLRGCAFGPLFVDPNNGDYHLKSEGWRWSRSESQWVYDDVTSPCIDAGNPGSPLAKEVLSVPRDPCNIYGKNIRINMGAYGGTAQAGIPPHNWALLADFDNDLAVNNLDLGNFVENWLKSAKELTADLNRDGRVDMMDYALLAEDWARELY